jgi:hypothetical protein
MYLTTEFNNLQIGSFGQRRNLSAILKNNKKKSCVRETYSLSWRRKALELIGNSSSTSHTERTEKLCTATSLALIYNQQLNGCSGFGQRNQRYEASSAVWRLQYYCQDWRGESTTTHTPTAESQRPAASSAAQHPLTGRFTE